MEPVRLPCEILNMDETQCTYGLCSKGAGGALSLRNYSPTFLLLSALRVITSGMFFSLILPLPSRVRVTSSGKHALSHSSLNSAQGSSFVEVPTLHKDLTCVFPLDVPPHVGRRGARLSRGAPPWDSALHAGAGAPKCLWIGPNESSGPQYEAR